MKTEDLVRNVLKTKEGHLREANAILDRDNSESSKLCVDMLETYIAALRWVLD